MGMIDAVIIKYTCDAQCARVNGLLFLTHHCHGTMWHLKPILTCH